MPSLGAQMGGSSENRRATKTITSGKKREETGERKPSLPSLQTLLFARIATFVAPLLAM